MLCIALLYLLLSFPLTGGTSGHLTDAYEGDEWGLAVASRITSVNVSGTLALVMAVWDHMRAQSTTQPSAPAGHITILSSSAALFGPPSFATYAASKAYLYHFAQCLRQISIPHRINVTAVCPGFIESGMTHSMVSTGGKMPESQLASPEGMAARIELAIERNEGVAMWPLNQILPLYAARAASPLCEELGRWIGTRSGLITNVLS